MFNLNDFKVEQEIAHERYQTIIQARQVARANKLNRTAQPQESLLFQRLRTRLGRHLIKLGCHLQQGRQKTASLAC
jgi:hypothetical protein